MVGSQIELFSNEISNSFLHGKISAYLIDRLSNLLAMDFDLRQPYHSQPELHIKQCIKRLQIHFSANPNIKLIDDFQGIFELFTIAITEETQGTKTFNPHIDKDKSSQVSSDETRLQEPQGSHVSKLTSSSASTQKIAKW